MPRPDGLTVLHLVPSLVGGGAERQIGLLAPALLRAGLAVHVAFLHGGVNLRPLLAAGVPVHALPSRGSYDPLVLVRLVRLIRAIRADVVQTWLTHMDVVGGAAARLAKVPHVLSERSAAEMYPPTWKNRLRLRSGLSAMHIVANSAAGCAYWASNGREGGCHVIRNGLALQEICSAQPADPADLGLVRDARLVVFAGRYSEEKNPLLLLSAATRVLEERLDAALVMFGEGPLMGELRSSAARSPHASRIRVQGYAPDLWRWLKAASVVVCPSRVEGNPNIVVEAMAAGSPLVVARIPSHEEILDDQCALFCDPSSERSIAEAILIALGSPSRMEDRAREAQSRARQWNIESAAQQYLALYEDIVRGEVPMPRHGSRL